MNPCFLACFLNLMLFWSQQGREIEACQGGVGFEREVAEGMEDVWLVRSLLGCSGGHRLSLGCYCFLAGASFVPGCSFRILALM